MNDDSTSSQYFIANKDKVSARANDGLTPLNVAESERHKELADFLRQHVGSGASHLGEANAK
jgi:ankyrin repeat protein